ncbi:MAG: endonuclease VII domain-containing protein [Planctomycetota bacterium]
MSEYYRDKRYSDGHTRRCKACARAYAREYEHRRRGRYRLRQGQGRIEISPAEYDRLLQAQGGVCAICGRVSGDDGRRLAIDHDHTTEQARGLLCLQCNVAIGMFQDSPDLCVQAGVYLRKHTPVHTQCS